MNVFFKRISADAKPFAYSRQGDACLDVFKNGKLETITPFQVKTVWTDIAIDFPTGYVGIIKGRSGLTSQGLLVQVGTIDADYRGNIGITLLNMSNKIWTLEPYMKLAQFCLYTRYNLNMIEVDELSETGRGSAGFGSSGYK